MTVSVHAPARVHLGLLQMSTGYRQRYLGLGMAIDPFAWQLDIDLRSGSAGFLMAGEALDDEYRLAAEGLARRCMGAREIQMAITVRRGVTPHVGLGAKTSLLCGVLAACDGLGLLPDDWSRLRHWTGRGGTSGVGINTAVGGGVVIDAGHAVESEEGFEPSSRRGVAETPPLLGRWRPNWRFLTVRVIAESGVAGQEESRAFQAGAPVGEDETRELSALVLYEMMPALTAGDLRDFSHALQASQSLGFKRFEWTLQSEAAHAVSRIALESGAWCAALSSVGNTLLIAGTDLDQIEGDLRRSSYGGQIDIVPTSVNNCGIQMERNVI